jgi:hypothetical protein
VPLHPLSPPRTLEISYFNVESTASTTSKIAVAGCEFQLKIFRPGKMYASGRYRKTYPKKNKNGIKEALFPAKRKAGLSSSHSRALGYSSPDKLDS